MHFITAWFSKRVSGGYGSGLGMHLHQMCLQSIGSKQTHWLKQHNSISLFCWAFLLVLSKLIFPNSDILLQLCLEKNASHSNTVQLLYYKSTLIFCCCFLWDFTKFFENVSDSFSLNACCRCRRGLTAEADPPEETLLAHSGLWKLWWIISANDASPVYPQKKRKIVN